MKLSAFGTLCCLSALGMGAFWVSRPAPAAPKIAVPAVAATDGFKAWLAQNAEAKAAFAPLLALANQALNEKPNPIERITTEGLLESDPKRIRSRESVRDMAKIEALVWAFQATGETRFSDKAREFIIAWAKINQPTENSINARHLVPLAVAYSAIRGSFPEADKSVVDEFLRAYGQAGMRRKSSEPNNWRSNQINTIGQIGLAIQDQTLIDFAVENFKNQIARSLRPDGSSYDLERRDAMHYHVFNVEPLLALATAFERAQIRFGDQNAFEFTSDQGASLQKSVAFIAPYFSGEKTYAEFVRSKEPFDRKRGNAKQRDFIAGTLFDPRKAQGVMEMATFFDPNLRALVERGPGGPGLQAALADAKPNQSNAPKVSWRLFLSEFWRRSASPA